MAEKRITSLLKVQVMSFEDSQLARWLSMANVRAKKSIKGKVFDLAKNGVCLIDGCGCKSFQRGLYCRHYQLFYRAKMALPKKERIVFEQEQIEAGRILAAHQISEIRRPNPFTSGESESA